MKNENKFQRELIKEIESRMPGCMVLKNDPNYIQGIPDLTVLYKKKWAVLECKKSKDAPFRPNQERYISSLNKMSFAASIYPENKEEVLDALQQSLQPRRHSRISRSK